LTVVCLCPLGSCGFVFPVVTQPPQVNTSSPDFSPGLSGSVEKVEILRPLFSPSTRRFQVPPCCPPPDSTFLRHSQPPPPVVQVRRVLDGYGTPPVVFSKVISSMLPRTYPLTHPCLFFAFKTPPPLFCGSGLLFWSAGNVEVFWFSKISTV